MESSPLGSAWERLHFELSTHHAFWLALVATDDEAFRKELRRRTHNWCSTHGYRFVLHRPAATGARQFASELRESLDPTVLHWITLADEEDGSNSLATVLQAMNQRRDAYLARDAFGVVVEGDAGLKREARTVAPDLFSIRACLLEPGDPGEHSYPTPQREEPRLERVHVLPDRIPWERYWVPRPSRPGEQPVLAHRDADGFLLDPSDPRSPNWQKLPTLGGLVGHGCVVLLGQPGAGKTDELLAHEADLRNSIESPIGLMIGDSEHGTIGRDSIGGAGHQILRLDLAGYNTDEGLRRALASEPRYARFRRGYGELTLLLDGLDEGWRTLEVLPKILIRELSSISSERRAQLRLRIACRSATWAQLEEFQTQLRQLWPEDGAFAVCDIAPLTSSDVKLAAKQLTPDADAFLAALDQSGAAAFANFPLTALALVKTFQPDGPPLPSDQRGIYELFLAKLASKEHGSPETSQNLAVAGRIGVLSLLANRTVVRDEHPEMVPSDALSLAAVCGHGKEPLGDGREVEVGESEVRAALATGLFGGAPDYRWAHQSYAEYLAARQLRFREIPDERLLLLLRHPGSHDKRVVPQLQGLAVWLATCSEAVFDHLLRTEPETLLLGDIGSLRPSERARLVEVLISAQETGRAPVDEHDLWEHLHKLAHPGLADQLRPLITDRARPEAVRCSAIAIARACGANEFATGLVTIALDPTEGLRLRTRATASVGPETAAGLAALLEDPALHAGDDHDELRGSALSVLWPATVSDEQMFAALTPPQQSFFVGAYYLFLRFLPRRLEELPEERRRAVLAAGLAWAAEIPLFSHAEGRWVRERWMLLFELSSRLLALAWSEYRVGALAEPFLPHLYQRLRHRMRPEFLPLEVERETRRRLLADLAGLVVSGPGDVHRAAYPLGMLTRPEDMGWLVERFDAAPTEREAEAWTRLMTLLVNWDRPQAASELLAATESRPQLRERTKGVWECQLDSEWAEEQRRHLRFLESLRAAEGRPSPRLSLRDQLTTLLREGIESLAAWPRIFDTFQPDQDPQSVDITQRALWWETTRADRDRVIDAAEFYVRHWRDRDPRAFSGSSHYGYCAWVLLANERPELFADLPDEMWQRWASVILSGQPMVLDHDWRLVGEALQRAPAEIRGLVREMIRTEGQARLAMRALRALPQLLDDELARSLLNVAAHEELDADVFRQLLDLLLENEVAGARELLAGWLSVPIPRDETKRLRAVRAAVALLGHLDDNGWDAVWPAYEADAAFGREVSYRFAEDAYTRGQRGAGRFSIDQLEALYAWLCREFPPDEDDELPGHLVHAPVGNKRFKVQLWRGSLLNELTRRGSYPAVAALRRLAERFPEQRWLERNIEEAHAAALESSWQAPAPSQVLDFLCDAQRRFVRSDAELLEAVVASMERLQHDLQHGSPPAAQFLWNKLDRDRWRPGDEGQVSDFIVRHLRQDLVERGVVLGREVQVQARTGASSGQRVDIRADAIHAGAMPEQLSCIIEVKGCWNEGVNTHMEVQLRDRYLATSDATCGIYLVVYFDQASWDPADKDRRDRARRLLPGLAKARRELGQQAEELSSTGSRIESFVLDASLARPAGAPPNPGT